MQMFLCENVGAEKYEPRTSETFKQTHAENARDPSDQFSKILNTESISQNNMNLKVCIFANKYEIEFW